MKAILTITVYYDDSLGPEPSHAVACLHESAMHLAENGLLSREFEDLIVDDWTANVETSKEGSRDG